MAKCSLLASILVLASIASLAVGIAPGVRAAGDKDTGTQLSLSSGYGGYWLLGGKARSVHLSATLDGKGAGKGTLSIASPGPTATSDFPQTPEGRRRRKF
jgi:hypothetical protein